MNSNRLAMIVTWTLLGIALALLWLVAGPANGPATPVYAADLTVCPAGQPTCDYATVQDAVDAAGDGDVIKVATGVYTDVHQRAGITQTVYVSKTVTIRGGYSADLTAWDSEAYSTTLDAGGQGRVLYITGNISPTVEGLRITGGNGGGQDGGGLFIISATATISGNQIFSNTASEGGGLCVISATATISGNQVYSNTASQGGGLYVISATATISNNQVYSNTAGAGGGLALSHSNITLSANTILSNTATSGGGLVLTASEATLVNNIIANNRANAQGSGLSIHGSSARALHTTIARNAGGGSAGLYVTDHTANISTTYSALWLTNTILVSHSLGITVGAGSTATLAATLWGTGTWANQTDWGGAGTIATGTVNVRGDPTFADPGAGDYHITEGSAARDSGVDASVTVDIDGEARPDNAGYDIGADEFHPTFYVHLPAVMRNSWGMPEVLILDQNGVEQDWDWLRTNFGGVEITRTASGPAYRACVLQEIEGPATQVVKVTEGDNPQAGVTVIRYWPDAPALPAELVGWYDQGVYDDTNAAGQVGFPMGFGDYYFPPGAGASSVWVADASYPSDLVGGLGMLGGTNHIHLDVQFCLAR
jgi:hypothetical protein